MHDTSMIGSSGSIPSYEPSTAPSKSQTPIPPSIIPPAQPESTPAISPTLPQKVGPVQGTDAPSESTLAPPPPSA